MYVREDWAAAAWRSTVVKKIIFVKINFFRHDGMFGKLTFLQWPRHGGSRKSPIGDTKMSKKKSWNVTACRGGHDFFFAHRRAGIRCPRTPNLSRSYACNGRAIAVAVNTAAGRMAGRHRFLDSCQRRDLPS